MRKAFRFAGVDESFTSEQFDREWEKSSAKQGDKYQFMEKLIKLPGFRSFDRNFDRLPESMRWIVEKVVHDPEKPPAPKPKLPDDLFETVRGRFGDDVAAPAEVRRPRVRRLARLHLTPRRRLERDAAPAPGPRPRPRSRSSSTPTGPGSSRTRGAALRGDELRRHGRRAGDDRRRLRPDRLGDRHRDAGRAAHPLRRGDDRRRHDAGRALQRASRNGWSWSKAGRTAGSTSPTLLRSLREEGVRALLCEGGPTLHGALQAAGLVDELFLTIAPKLAGGEAPAHPRGRACRHRPSWSWPGCWSRTASSSPATALATAR